MPDPRFFIGAGPFRLEQLAAIAGATLSAGNDAQRVIDTVAALDEAGPHAVSFLDNRKYLPDFTRSKAGACLVHPDHAEKAPAGMALLLTKAPYKAYALVAQAFYPLMPPPSGISPQAIIDSTAVLAADVSVEPGAVIMAGAKIGRLSQIGANAVIGPRVEIGEMTRIGYGASLSHSLIGNRVVIYPGARLGQDGFGFAIDPAGHIRIPQLGRVIVEDDVEIGANSTIDRGAGPDTVIGQGCMIDNLVQIGHNVHMGKGCVVVSQAGISGSTQLDHHVVVAAQAGLTGHLKIGAGARIAAQSGVMRDVAVGEEVGGSPAVPSRQWLRQAALLGKLARGKSLAGKGD